MPLAMAVRFEPEAAVGAKDVCLPAFWSSYEPLTVGALSMFCAGCLIFGLKKLPGF
jgi:hypothetical protein